MPPALMGSTDGDTAGVSRVQMDGQGLLKVQHLLHIAKAASGGGGGGGGGMYGHAHARGTGPSMDSVADPPASYPGPYTGGTAGGASEHSSSVLVPVTFVLFPEETVQANGEPDEADGDVHQTGRDGGTAARASPVL
jgi:hypothetical protein